MKPIFYVAGGLLGVSGMLHLVEVFRSGVFANEVFPTLFMGMLGAAYLFVGYHLLRRNDSAVIYGILIPSIGLMATLLRVKSSMALFNTVALVIEILVIAACVYLSITGRVRLGRVH